MLVSRSPKNVQRSIQQTENEVLYLAHVLSNEVEVKKKHIPLISEIKTSNSSEFKNRD